MRSSRRSVRVVGLGAMIGEQRPIQALCTYTCLFKNPKFLLRFLSALSLSLRPLGGTILIAPGGLGSNALDASRRSPLDGCIELAFEIERCYHRLEQHGAAPTS